MIQPVTQDRWQEAQAAELAVVSYDHDNSACAYGHIFNYLGISVDQQGKRIVEVGCGAYPAVSYCVNVHAMVVEPLWFDSLKEMALEGFVQWVREPFEDMQTIRADEVWLYNALQHVRDPELVIEKAKQIAPTVRFFEPVDYPTCVYHPPTFSRQDFIRWFGDSVKMYTDRIPGFFDSDCVYGTWKRDA